MTMTATQDFDKENPMSSEGKMNVRVVYRDPRKGRELYFSIVNITIRDCCPVCGGKRGKPVLRRYCEDGEWYSVHNWTNPCGHVDKYRDVIQEHLTRKAKNV